jgi:hypothetical protein
MAEDRAERIALVEAAFRVANDRMAGWEEVPPDQAALFFCECSSLECREKVPLTRDEYEGIRGSSEQFVVVPGHEVDDLEEVVDELGGRNVILKPASVFHITRASDPRTGEDGEIQAEAQRLADEIVPPPDDGDGDPPG